MRHQYKVGDRVEEYLLIEVVQYYDKKVMWVL